MVRADSLSHVTSVQTKSICTKKIALIKLQAWEKSNVNWCPIYSVQPSEKLNASNVKQLKQISGSVAVFKNRVLPRFLQQLWVQTPVSISDLTRLVSLAQKAGGGERWVQEGFRLCVKMVCLVLVGVKNRKSSWLQVRKHTSLWRRGAEAGPSPSEGSGDSVSSPCAQTDHLPHDRVQLLVGQPPLLACNDHC